MQKMLSTEMPIYISHQDLLSRIIKEYPKIFRTDGSILYCLICNSSVSSNRFNNIKQHIESGKHIELERRKSNINQTLLPVLQSQIEKVNQFHKDVCKTFMKLNFTSEHY